MPAPTKLSLYNGALLVCGERALASLSEEREPRRLLDQVWDTGAVDFCLGEGQWRFATRTVEQVKEVAVAPPFGHPNAFAIPSDHLRTVALCSDPYLNTPLLNYSVEAGYWFADIDPLYISYVSNDASYGGNYALWPQDFARYVEAYLASRIILKLSQGEKKADDLEKKVERLLRNAKSSDAMESPTKFTPQGSWVSAARSGGRRDRGNRGSLIG